MTRVLDTRNERVDEVLRELCALSSEVMHKVFKCQEAADCFCPDKEMHPLIANSYRFSPEVLDFIKAAVNEKIEREAS